MQSTYESHGRTRVRAKRNGGFATQIAKAKAQGNGANLTGDAFLDVIAPEAVPEVDPTYLKLRMDVRRIIAEDAAAANLQNEPVDEPETNEPVSTHRRSHLGLIAIGCAIGAGAAFIFANAM